MVTYAVISEKGSREINEDYVGVKEKNKEYCFALADGLGGHGRGEVASEIAVETVLHKMEKEEISADFLENAFKESQKKLLEQQEKLHARDEMKTTMIVCCMNEDSIRWGHIGDSRLYLFEKGKLVKRTLDHSVPQMLVYAGEIREKDIRHHPDRNRLLKVLGTEWESGQYELGEVVNRKEGQRLLLCSDGFWEYIDEKKMQKSLKQASSVQDWANKMEEWVQKNGKGKDMDNYSAICIWCD